MRIRVTFDKNVSNFTETRITVSHAGSFPSRKIFRGPTDYPSNLEYSLSPQKTNTISKHFRDPVRAKLWAEEQVDSLRIRLESWYNRLTLKDYEVNL